MLGWILLVVMATSLQHVQCHKHGRRHFENLRKNYEIHRATSYLGIKKAVVPNLTDLFSTKTKDGVQYEILGCKITSTKNNCVWSFVPDKACLDKLSLGKVYDTMTQKAGSGTKLVEYVKKIFPPNAFQVKKFAVTTCGEKKGAVDFQASLVKPFDVIEKKLKLNKGDISLQFNYQDLKAEFNLEKISINIKGEATIGGQTLKFSLDKSASTNEVLFKLSADELKVAEVYKAFAEKGQGDQENNLMESEGAMSKLVIEKAVLTGSRGKDGSYDLSAQGKAKGVPKVGEITGFLIINKLADGPSSVGIGMSLKNVQPAQIIVNLLKKDVQSPLLKSVKLDMTVLYASNDISAINNAEIGKMIESSASSDLEKGAVIDVSVPIREVVKSTGTKADVAKLPEKINVKIMIKEGKVEFKFPEDALEDGINILLALVPKAAEMLQRYLFKEPVDIKILAYSVDIKTKAIKVEVSIPDPVVIGVKFFRLNNGYFIIDKKTPDDFEFRMNASLSLGEAKFKVEVEKKQTFFKFIGSVGMLTSEKLIETFGSKDLASDLGKKNKKLNFGICDLKVEAQFGEGIDQGLRVTGNPILFNWDGLKLEGYMIKEVDKTPTRKTLIPIGDDEIVSRAGNTKPGERRSPNEILTSDSASSGDNNNNENYIYEGEVDEIVEKAQKDFSKKFIDEVSKLHYSSPIEVEENESESGQTWEEPGEDYDESTGGESNRFVEEMENEKEKAGIKYAQQIGGNTQFYPAPDTVTFNTYHYADDNTQYQKEKQNAALTSYNKLPVRRNYIPSIGETTEQFNYESDNYKRDGLTQFENDEPIGDLEDYRRSQIYTDPSMIQLMRKKRDITPISHRKMVLAVVATNIRVDKIVKYLFDKEIKGLNWMVNFDMALVISNTDKTDFKLPEVKKLVEKVEAGVYFTGSLTIPTDCAGDSLCELSKKTMKPGAKLFVNANLNPGGFTMKADYGSFKLGPLTLNSVYLEINVTPTTDNFQLKAKMQLDKLKFKGSIGLTAAAGLILDAKMEGMWEKPFGMPISIGNIQLGGTLQPPTFVPIKLDTSGKVNLGKVKGKEIIFKVAGGFDFPTSYYGYGKINKLSLGAIAEAFEITASSLPKIILDTGFPDEVSVAFSTSPKPIKLEQFDVTLQQGVNIKGTVDILGYKLMGELRVRRKELMLDVRMAPVSIANGALGVYKSLQDKENGPRVNIVFSKTTGSFKIQGAVIVLGIGASVDIDVGDKGLQFSVVGNLFGVIEANLTVKAPYTKPMTLAKAGFEVSSCLSAAVKSAEQATAKDVQDSGQKTQNDVAEAERGAKEKSSWFESIKKGIEKLEVEVKGFKTIIERKAGKLEKYEKKVAESCKQKCGKSFMCPVKCKLEKIRLKIKITIKKITMKFYDNAMKLGLAAIETAKKSLESAKSVLEATQQTFNAVTNAAASGMKAVKDIAQYALKNLITIHHLCFKTGLEDAAKACFNVNANVTFLGKHNKAFDVKACLDVGFVKSIGNAIKDKLYPGLSSIGDKIKGLKAKMGNKDQTMKEIDEVFKKNKESMDKLSKEVKKKAEADTDDDEDHQVARKFEIRNMTLEEARLLIYDDTPTFTSDEDDIEMEDFTQDLDTQESRSEIPINMAEFVDELTSRSEDCALTRTLVKNYLKIADPLASFHSDVIRKRNFLHDTNEYVKRFTGEWKKKMLVECEKYNCTNEEEENAMREANEIKSKIEENVDKAGRHLTTLGGPLEDRTRAKLLKQIKDNGKTPALFLQLLKKANNKVSINQKPSVMAVFNNAYELVDKLLTKERNYDIKTFKDLQLDMLAVRDEIPCAA